METSDDSITVANLCYIIILYISMCHYNLMMYYLQNIMIAYCCNMISTYCNIIVPQHYNTNDVVIL